MDNKFLSYTINNITPELIADAKLSADGCIHDIRAIAAGILPLSELDSLLDELRGYQHILVLAKEV